MPTTTQLLGAGFPALPAALLGNDPVALAGAGTTQGAATAIVSHLSIVTATGGNTGVVLPAGASIGSAFYVVSAGGTAAKVYCPVGQTLNGTTNGGCTFSAAGMLIFVRTSTTAWWVTGTATGTVA